MTPDTPITLIERLHAKIHRLGPDDCWPWIGAQSRGKGRETTYGIIKEGGSNGRVLRVNRLQLMLLDVPAGTEGHELLQLLRAINRLHEHEEASHSCDVSLCCNPRHLKWEEHAANVTNATARRAGQPWRPKRPKLRMAKAGLCQ